MKHGPLERYLIRNMKQYVRLDDQGVSIYVWPTPVTREDTTEQLPQGFDAIPGLDKSPYYVWSSQKYSTMAVLARYSENTNMMHVLRFHSQEIYHQNHTLCINDAAKWFAIRTGSQATE